ncbi:MAG: hypothetical protein ABI217_12250 [Chthoniobacterales bacterium]
MVVESDGPPQPRYFFQDTDRRLGFRIDPKMTVSGSAAAASFQFTDLRSASMRLRKSAGPLDVPIDEKGIEKYQTVARTFVPTDATEVQLVDQVPGAVAINGWESVQFAYTYKLFGATYRRAITFLNLPEHEQLVFEVTAGSDDFKKAYAPAYRVINSIYVLPLVFEAGPT